MIEIGVTSFVSLKFQTIVLPTIIIYVKYYWNEMLKELEISVQNKKNIYNIHNILY